MTQSVDITRTERAPAGHANTLLELAGVGRTFGAVQAVRDVSLTLPKGERHAILGPNGAGKTTLFNLITGDVLPDRGTIQLNGEDVTALSSRRRIHKGLRRTYQQSLLFGTLTVRDNLFVALRGVSNLRLSIVSTAADASLRDAADNIAERVGLADYLHGRVDMLSYGQQRQLEIGMALVGKPAIILFDEPAAGLSPSERRNLVTLIEGLPRDLTIALVEHDLDIALALSDRVTIMQDGAVILTGTPQDIAADPTVKRIYLGDRHG